MRFQPGLVLVGMIALLGASPSQAQPTRPATGPALVEALRAYDRGDFLRAEALLRAALGAVATGEERAKAHLYLGLVLATRGDRAAASESFRAAAIEDPDVAPEREHVVPDILRLYDAARAAVLGTLRVEAPERARVIVDGTLRGAAPLVVRVPVGRHAVRVVSLDGLRALDQKGVLVRVRAPALVRGALVPRLGKLALRVRPANAAIAVDGKRVAASGGVLELVAGRRRIRLEHPERAPVEREVFVAPASTTSLDVDLPLPPPAWYERRDRWGWIAIGIAGAAAVAGLLSAKSARANDDEVNRGLAAGNLEFARWQTLTDAARRNSLAANVLFGVSGAAAITGIVLLVTGRPKAERPPPRARLQMNGPGHALALDF